MIGRFKEKLVAAVMVSVALLCMGLPVSAEGLPATGDGSGMMLPVVIGLLAVSAVLIVVFLVLSAKNKRR